MFNYNGNNLSNLIKVNEVGRPLLPPRDLSTREIYGKPGAFFFEKRDQPIVLPITVSLIEKDLVSYREKARELAYLLEVDEPKRIILSDEPDKYINGILMDESMLDEIYTVGQGTLNFFCPDPYWYAIDDDIFSYSGAGNYTIVRKGLRDSLPLIEIKGTNLAGSITLSTNSHDLVYDGPLSANETLVIDSELITAYRVRSNGSKLSAINDLDKLDMPKLFPGANSIKISTKGTATVTNLKITSRSRW